MGLTPEEYWGTAPPRQFDDITPDPARRREHLLTQIALAEDERTQAIDMGDTRRADTLSDTILSLQRELLG